MVEYCATLVMVVRYQHGLTPTSSLWVESSSTDFTQRHSFGGIALVV